MTPWLTPATTANVTWPLAPRTAAAVASRAHERRQTRRPRRPRRPFAARRRVIGRKLLVAAVGVATISYAAGRSTTSNLAPPFVATDAADGAGDAGTDGGG